MIKSFTAFTRELDDEAVAVAEILEAIDPERNLLKHSVGIISCFSEFGDTGALKAICDALPFDCIGASTCICATGSEVDQLMLTITVLTSDDCSFKSIAVPVDESYEDTIYKSVTDMLKQSDEKPAVILCYLPLINSISGDMLLEAIDNATDGIPLFGTTAVDHMPDYSTTKTIWNGEMYRETVVLCSVYGNPCVTYEIASIDEEKIRRQKAIITGSNGNLLIGVNGKSALEYMEEIGLTKLELSTGLGILPLVVDHKDGTKPVARAVFTLTPDGHAVCGGAMPVNATLSLGRIDREDVLKTTESVLRPLVDNEGVILSYSCMARYLTLGADNTAEAELVRDLAGEMPYMFACSGGEICPLPDADGELKNYYHNYTIVFCRLS